VIFEYALDPKLIVEWAISGTGRYVGQIGMDHRRLLSDFPKGWKERTVGEFYERFGYDDSSVEFQNAQPNFEAYLQLLTDYTVCRSAEIRSDADWFRAAIDEHNKHPFYAIMSKERVDGEQLDFVITPEVIDDVRNQKWYLPTIKSSRKSAVEIADVLAPMLTMARQIVLVDPYFDPDKERFLTSFAEMMRRVFFSELAITRSLRIVLMTGVEQKHQARDGVFTPEQKRRVADDLRVKAERVLPAFLPKGVVMDFYCLTNPERGDPLHNRFVLTDVGGVIVPYGLDDYDSVKAHDAKDDLQPMHKGIYEGRWIQYGERKGIDVVLGPVPIAGAA